MQGHRRPGQSHLPPVQLLYKVWDILGNQVDDALRTRLDDATERALGTRLIVYLTGGDAEALRDWLETRVELRADLVLEGLELFAFSRIW